MTISCSACLCPTAVSPGSIHNTKPHRLVQGRNQESGDSWFKWPLDSDLIQTVPRESQLFTVTISGDTDNIDKLCMCSSSSEPTSSSIKKLATCIAMGRLRLHLQDHMHSVSLGKACLHLVFACLVFVHFAISDNKKSLIRWLWAVYKADGRGRFELVWICCVVDLSSACVTPTKIP